VINSSGIRSYEPSTLDWADNNEKWDSQEIRLDDKVLKGSTVFPLPESPLPSQALKEGGPYKKRRAKRINMSSPSLTIEVQVMTDNRN
jgi:hypothetical protein